MRAIQFLGSLQLKENKFGILADSNTSAASIEVHQKQLTAGHIRPNRFSGNNTLDYFILFS